MQDYDPSKPPRQHAGMELVRACADSMAFLEAGPDRSPSDDTKSTLGSVEDQKVQLMTMHKAKGLEFRAVILVGLSEFGLGSREGATPENMEAARNLLYVAVTRAKDALVLSSRHGLSLKPGRLVTERSRGRPSWLLERLYEDYGVEVTQSDEHEFVSHGPPWKQTKVVVANKGYPVAQVRRQAAVVQVEC